MERAVIVFVDNIFYILNWGISAGFVLGIIYLLRPVTTRLLKPRQRYWLWALGWMWATFPVMFIVMDAITVFPVTLWDFLVPRVDGGGLPHYLPHYEGVGRYDLALPGGSLVPVELNDAIGLVIACVFLAGSLIVGRKIKRGSKELLELGRQGELIHRPDCKYLTDSIDIYLCDNIPTSFVHQRGGKWNPAIYLQKDLPEHRRELILKHEMNHIHLRHCTLKGYMVVAMELHWWNPLVWLAYFATCRDLELDCDEKTMEELTPEERREYAHTLVELGVGRQLWEAPLCFGECDAAVRVKAVAAWKPMGGWRKLGTWLLTFLLLLCFAGGPGENTMGSYWRELTQEYPARIADLLSSHLDVAEEDVLEIWLAENYKREDSYCLLSDGTWRSVSIAPFNGGVSTSGGTVVEAPDLTGCERIY